MAFVDVQDEPTVMNTAADCTEVCATDGSAPMPASTGESTTTAPTAVSPTAGGGAYGSEAGKERLTVLPLMMAGFALAMARFL
jgi:hypothetical protein